MARTRRLDELRADAYERADLESATDRHPPARVTRYINQGIAELRDLIINARGRAFFRKNPPQTITTIAGQTRYALNTDFYRLISIRLVAPGGYLLDAFTPELEPELREVTGAGSQPTHYELQDGYVELLPSPAASYQFVLEYIPTTTDLVADSDPFDGFNGWEEYVVCYAAKQMALKDDEKADVSEMNTEMASLRARIQKLAPHRDAFRSETVKDVRRTRLYRRGGLW